jgi:GNAT superfamily N-acetyltransferase
MEGAVTDEQGSSARIRSGRPHEGKRLREIAVDAKSHWGYDLDRVRQWAAMGDFSADGLRQKEVYVAEVEERVVAWAALIPRGELIWLDDLWVEPKWIGKGIGSLLFRHAVERAIRLGGKQLEWEAEPNAVGFYESLGGRYLRDSEPSLWGRVIPVMGVDLVDNLTSGAAIQFTVKPRGAPPGPPSPTGAWPDG